MHRSVNREDKFRTWSIETDGDLFDRLSGAVEFEDLGKGRCGAVLLRPDDVRGFPIVRTTSKLSRPAQYFHELHWELAEQIRETAALEVDFNNALIEIYSNAYAKMGSHSDQALDLHRGSHIAVFSCYRFPERTESLRVLALEEKGSLGEEAQIPLQHNSVVVFSLSANQRFKHKIVLNKANNPQENEWLGITFRTSRTFVKFFNGEPRFETGGPLTLADEVQRTEFYALRGRENRELNFAYPEINYTISRSDLMTPVAIGRSN